MNDSVQKALSEFLKSRQQNPENQEQIRTEQHDTQQMHQPILLEQQQIVEPRQEQTLDQRILQRQEQLEALDQRILQRQEQLEALDQRILQQQNQQATNRQLNTPTLQEIEQYLFEFTQSSTNGKIKKNYFKNFDLIVFFLIFFFNFLK